MSKYSEDAKELLSWVGLGDKLQALPRTLSGGEVQRVAIARAVMNKPEILIADEPTGNLNSSSSEAVLNILTELNENDQSIVMVTHEVKSACRANRIIFLKDCQIEDELKFEKELDADEKETRLLKWLAGKDW